VGPLRKQGTLWEPLQSLVLNLPPCSMWRTAPPDLENQWPLRRSNNAFATGGGLQPSEDFSGPLYRGCSAALGSALVPPGGFNVCDHTFGIPTVQLFSRQFFSTVLSSVGMLTPPMTPQPLRIPSSARSVPRMQREPSSNAERLRRRIDFALQRLKRDRDLSEPKWNLSRLCREASLNKGTVYGWFPASARETVPKADCLEAATRAERAERVTARFRRG
jgi:hypothetical protein